MSEVIERRAFSADFRIESEEGEKSPKIIGYAAKFNSLSEEMWGFRETIAKGAFAEALKDGDVRALFNHDPNIVLGRSTAGTLVLTEDDIGLRYEITPPDTQTVRDIIESIKRGDISQSSFAFSMQGDGNDEWQELPDDKAVRTIKKVSRLFDISPVTYPAYSDTESGVRSAEEVFKEYRSQILKVSPEPERVPDFSLRRAKLDLLEVE